MTTHRSRPIRSSAVSPKFALISVIWGIQMSAAHDYTLTPAHGHLNLIGFVSMSVFGAYYALNPKAAASRLAPLHFWLTVATVIILVPGIVLAIDSNSELLAQIGSLLAVLSMALFGYVVVTQRSSKPETAARQAAAE